MTAMRRHPLVAYFVLAYAITWVLVFPLVLQGLGLTGELVPSGWHALGGLRAYLGRARRQGRGRR